MVAKILHPVFLTVQVLRPKNQPIVKRMEDAWTQVGICHLALNHTPKLIDEPENRENLQRLGRRIRAIRVLLASPKYRDERHRYRDLLRNFELTRDHEDPHDEYVFLHVRNRLTEIENAVLAAEGDGAVFS